MMTLCLFLSGNLVRPVCLIGKPRANSASEDEDSDVPSDVPASENTVDNGAESA